MAAAWVSKQHVVSDFAWTTRVMSLLLTWNLSHLLFTRGLEGSGMGEMRGILVNWLQMSILRQQFTERGCRNNTAEAVSHEQQEWWTCFQLVASLICYSLKDWRARVWVCWAASWWISCKYPCRHGTLPIETTRRKLFPMNNKSDEPASNL